LAAAAGAAKVEQTGQKLAPKEDMDLSACPRCLPSFDLLGSMAVDYQSI
jgi:hypothetical protein